MAAYAELGVGDEQDGTQSSRVQQLIDKILELGVDGVGPLKGAEQIAEEHRAQYRTVDEAIDKLIKTHVRLVAATGFATGVGA